MLVERDHFERVEREPLALEAQFAVEGQRHRGSLARLGPSSELDQDAGKATYELDEAPDALSALATTHTQRKLAIRVQ